jgi:hypothetical protein
LSNRADVITLVVKRIPQAVPTRWNFKNYTMNNVSEHWVSLIECFEKIWETFTDKTTISLASGFIRLSKGSDFLFWLGFLHTVMPHVGMFFNKIQKKNVDSTEVYTFTNDSAAAINKICENLSESSLTEMEGQISKRTALDCVWCRCT